ncbi:RNA polymerase sigma factor [Ascidiimonas aurantiaca]|uniref:RNA polymerase sigma factor n=1 Tax=Ascidiimonas aurantiaca TaxID=1685432 RepID=UPI0030EBCA9A
MCREELIQHLFRTEFRKITSVLCKTFGIAQIELAEDIVSDTFLLAAEKWEANNIPDNPAAWLYAVARNKTKDYFKRDKIFSDKVAVELQQQQAGSNYEIDINLSEENIADSQLQMMFAICHPGISKEAQIGLSLRILCGFSIDEIASAFLTNKETINKRLFRGKSKLRELGVKMAFPNTKEIDNRLENVLATLYLLFNEGYYSATKHRGLRKDLCCEAMRLVFLLVENKYTNQPETNALLSLMCFHASRFEARTNENGEMVLYDDQDKILWNTELISRGEFYLNEAARGGKITKYHLEAAIAYWHTQTTEVEEKWEQVLMLYNQLLQVEYSPMAALNRTYALSKVNGKKAAVKEAEKLKLSGNYWFHMLLGNLYVDLDDKKASHHFKKASKLAKNEAEKEFIENRMELLIIKE